MPGESPDEVWPLVAFGDTLTLAGDSCLVWTSGVKRPNGRDRDVCFDVKDTKVPFLR